MKKVLYSFVALATILLFVNSAQGPAIKFKKGYTGAPDGTSNESTCASCHSAAAFGATAKLEIFDSTGTTAVTKYALGKLYVIRMTISTTVGTPVGYGFQMIDIRKKDTTNVKGFLPKVDQATNIGIDSIANGRYYAEHNARLTSNVINVKWRAPATDLGNIVFYAAGNAVDGGGSSGGDNGTPAVNIQLPSPISSGVSELAENVSIRLSPNPTPSTVAVTLESKMSKTLKIQVTDLMGRTMLTENWAVSAGQNQKSLDFQAFAKGAYMVQIIEGQDVISKKILKF